MGGWGSGRRQWPKKTTVEACAVFDLDAWVGAGLLDYNCGRIDSQSPGVKTISPLAYIVRYANDPTCLYLYLQFLEDGKKTKWQPVTLVSRPQYFGGERWHFFCPRCGRLARK